MKDLCKVGNIYVFNFLDCSKDGHLCYSDDNRVSEGLFTAGICEYGLVNPDLSISYLEE